MIIDIAKMKEHLEQAIDPYRKQGMQYGSAVFTVPEGLDENNAQMGLAAFLTVLEGLGCMPFHMETKGSSIERAILTVGQTQPREGAIRRVVYFRFMDAGDTEPAPPNDDGGELIQ